MLVFYVMTVTGLFILRKKMPNAERPYKAFGYPITGIVTNGVVVPNLPLPEGAKVEVVVLPNESNPPRHSMLELLQSLPPGPRAFKTWEEYERHLRQEKDAWER